MTYTYGYQYYEGINLLPQNYVPLRRGGTAGTAPLHPGTPEYLIYSIRYNYN